MTDRSSSNSWPALLDGAAETFAFRFFPDEQYPPSRPEYRTGAVRRQFSDRLADATRWVAAILGLVILAIGSVAVLGFVADGHAGSMDWRHYLLPAGIATLLITEAGLIAAVAVQDIRRRELETLLKRSEERMALAAESADLGLWRWDAKGDEFWATKHCQAMFGIRPGSEYNLGTIIDAIHEDDRALVTSALQSAMDTGETIAVEYRQRLGDGKVRWVRVRGRIARGSDSQVDNISGTIADISDEKNMRTEMDRQHQSLAHLTRVSLMGELSGALAHELNQPLTAILSNAQALQRMVSQQPLDIVELQSAISDIIDDDSRAGDVIRHLRTLLRKDDTKFELLDANAILLRALGLTRSDLTARRVTVVLQFDHRSALVRGDAVQLLQLVLNLILNAAEAMSGPGQSGGLLRVSSDMIGRDVHFSISDTGPGIEVSMLNKLFEPFVTSKKTGLGLGLSISRAITIGHDGKIWAENNPGRGATFHVTLPAAYARAS